MLSQACGETLRWGGNVDGWMFGRGEKWKGKRKGAIGTSAAAGRKEEGKRGKGEMRGREARREREGGRE